MQARGVLAVKRQPAQGQDMRRGLVDKTHAGADQLVVQESLRQKAPEEPLHHPVLQVQVHDLTVQGAGVTEDHGADRRALAPLPRLLIAGARTAQGVEGDLPGRVGPLVERRQDPAGGLVVAYHFVLGGGDQRLGAQELQRGGDRVAKVVAIQLQPVPRLLESPPATVLRKGACHRHRPS